MNKDTPMTMESRTASMSNGYEAAESLGITKELLAMLVCPVDHGSLKIAERALQCTVCDRLYTVEDGIPDMVVTDEQTER